jgi:hypothetical protein
VTGRGSDPGTRGRQHIVGTAFFQWRLKKINLLLSRRGVTLRVSFCNLPRGWCVIGYHVVSFHSVRKEFLPKPTKNILSVERWQCNGSWYVVVLTYGSITLSLCMQWRQPWYAVRFMNWTPLPKKKRAPATHRIGGRDRDKNAVQKRQISALRPQSSHD